MDIVSNRTTFASRGQSDTRRHSLTHNYIDILRSGSSWMYDNRPNDRKDDGAS